MEELAGRGVGQPCGRGDPDRHLVELPSLVRAQSWSGRLLDELLVAPLERAVAFAEGDDPAARLAQELDLDVPGREDLPLEVDRAVAEGSRGLVRAGGEGRRKVLRRYDPAHPPATPAGRGLDEQREADAQRVLDDRRDLIRPIDGRRLEGPGNHRDARRDGRPAGGELVTECGDRPVVGPDEGEPGRSDRLGEGGSFRQEAVARVDGVGAAGQRRLDDEVSAEVAVRSRRRSEPDGGVGRSDVQCLAIRVAVDRDGGDPQLVTGSDDSQRDLATVRDENPTEGPSLRKDSRLLPGLRAGCCHASFADSCRACRPASAMPKSVAAESRTAR